MTTFVDANPDDKLEANSTSMCMMGLARKITFKRLNEAKAILQTEIKLLT